MHFPKELCGLYISPMVCFYLCKKKKEREEKNRLTAVLNMIYILLKNMTM